MAGPAVHICPTSSQRVREDRDNRLCQWAFFIVQRWTGFKYVIAESVDSKKKKETHTLDIHLHFPVCHLCYAQEAIRVTSRFTFADGRGYI